jgi:mono/diheme cytochrome c family protein
VPVKNDVHSTERLYKALLLVASLVTFGYLLASALVENYFMEWHHHQREYRTLLFEKADDDHSRKIANNFRIELQQAVLPELDRVDRCLSCHLGADNPRMKGVPQPYGFHPEPYLEQHPIGRFGCTPCHQGQGRAIQSEQAKRDEHWAAWLLPLPYTEASCGVCHDAEALEDRGAPLLALGSRLFRERGCFSCHRLGERGGSFGPALDRVGRKDKHFFPMEHLAGEHTVVNWLYEHFLDPQAVVPESRMKKTPLTPEEARALTIHMLSLQDRNLPKEILAPDKYRALYESRYPPLADGETLYMQFCYGCHEEAVIGDTDPILEKELPAIRNPHYLSRISDQALKLFIRRGRPGTEMPAWRKDAGGLEDAEIDAIVSYLARSREYVSEETFVPLEPQDVEAGKEIFAEMCALCHGEDGRGDVAPGLTDPVFQEVYDDRLLGLTIRDGIEETQMLSFREMDLSDQDISDVMAYIRTLR